MKLAVQLKQNHTVTNNNPETKKRDYVNRTHLVSRPNQNRLDKVVQGQTQHKKKQEQSKA